MAKIEWILCPVCGNKTRNQIREDTVLLNFPLYCPKYTHEILIEEKQSWETQTSKLLYKMEKTVWTTRKHISAIYITI